MRSLKGFNEENKVCRMGGNIPSLNFVGLSVLVGTDTAKAGIPYTCLVRGQMPYLNAYMTAGTLGISYAVLSCIDWRPARILRGAGEAGSMLELCGAKASGNATYVGLHSATTLPVRGVVGEAVVLELLRKGKNSSSSIEDKLIGRDAGRPTYVVWAQINKPEAVVGEVCVAEEKGVFISMFATTVCIIVLLLDAQCHEWLAFSLVATGMFLNAVMAFLLRLQKFELPTANPAEGAPPGDSVIVLKDDPDMFCVLRGDEHAIQKLLQKEVKLNAGCVEHLPLFLVCVAFMAYSAVVVLGVPHMGASAQLLFVIAICIGTMTNLIKGSWNGKRGIAKEALTKYNIETVKVKKFGNRTAAVACVAASSTKLDALKAAGLLPTAGIVWQNWWTLLGTLDKSQVQKELATLSATVPQEDKELWTILRADMTDGLADHSGNLVLAQDSETALPLDKSPVQKELATLSATMPQEDKKLWTILRADMTDGLAEHSGHLVLAQDSETASSVLSPSGD